MTISCRQFDLEESDLDLVRETNLGQEALIRYHNAYQREDLEDAVHHFECAQRNCLSTHRCYAVVLVNLAKAKCITCHVDPTNADLDTVILLCQEALNLRRPGHPDRPATLLQFAQSLLFRYEKQGHTQSVADKINELMSEIRDLPEDTHERRAADLVLDTLRRCRVVNSGSLAELDTLVQKLKDDVQAHPDDYFDKPQRLVNLSTTLWRRYERHGILGDLDHLSVICEQGLRLLPTHHPDRLLCLRTFSVILWQLFVIRRDVGDLGKLIALSKDALKLTPEGHPDHSYWASVGEPVQRINGVYHPLH
ncbi:hypothetical protein EV363DRAFT_1196714 [Boletus edulis]|nr:hypothetical protein EV363DRAFT_1196714 [Boletus edulis]